MGELVEVTVEGVYVHNDQAGPPESGEKFSLALAEKGGARRLAIWIGAPEAFAIASKLGGEAPIHGEAPIRPLTIDLASNLIRELGAALRRVVITSHRDKVFYARLLIDHQGKQLDVDARPSDAIAAALRLDAPIFVIDEVFEQATAAA